MHFSLGCVLPLFRLAISEKSRPKLNDRLFRASEPSALFLLSFIYDVIV